MPGERLVRLAERFELVWATGWEERANEHLPWLLELPVPRSAHAHLRRAPPCSARPTGSSTAIEDYARGRPAAWIDDNLDQECREWAAAREEPTLLVLTEPAVGMSDEHVEQLLRWADEVSACDRRPGRRGLRGRGLIAGHEGLVTGRPGGRGVLDDLHAHLLGGLANRVLVALRGLLADLLEVRLDVT